MIAASSPRFKWVVLFSTLLAFVAYAFGFQVVPPLMTSIITEYGVSNAEAGLLMSCVLIPGIILSIPVSMVMDRYGVKATGGVALLFVILSSFLTATATSFTTLLVARLVLGVGGALILIVTPTIIPQWFPREELGKAMGLYTIGMPIGTVIAFPVAGSLAGVYGWRSAFYVSLAIAIVATAAYLLTVKNGPLYKRGDGFGGLSAFKNLDIWKLGLLWFFFNGALMCFNTWAPTLLTTYKGFTPVEASLYASMMSWVGLIAVPVFGSISDRLGKRKMFIVAGTLLVFLVEVGAAYSSGMLLVAMIVALGLVSAMVPGNVQTLPSEILGASRAGVGFAVLGICMNLGNAITQPIPGMVIDATGDYTLTLLTIAAFAAVSCVASLLVKAK
jgi:predicted MFS family arabinose efflux permease